MLLDEDTCHTAHASAELAEELGIQLIWLPNRSPKLNPLESVWGDGKDVISANKQYATIEDQVIRFLQYLESLSSRQTLHKSGVLSKHFWLRSALSKNFCGPASGS